MNKKTKLGIAILVLLNIALFFHLFAVYLDLPIPLINPTNSTQEQFMELSYPPSENGVKVYYSEYPINWTLRGLLCTVDLYLDYKTPLAEGTSISVYAIGCKYFDGIEIDHAEVIFAGAEANGPANAELSFNPTIIYQLNVTKSGIVNSTSNLPQSMYWMLPKPSSALGTIDYAVAGSYYPSLTLWFRNGSSVSAGYSLYLNHRIYVLGTDVVQQMEYNRKNNAMTFDGIMLGVFDVPTLIGLVVKEINDKNKKPNTDQSQASHNQTDQKIQRQKVDAKKQTKKNRNA